MKLHYTKHFHRLVPLFITLFLCLYCWNVNWGGKRWKGFFLSDSNGYYAYLPALIVFNDLDMTFLEPVKDKDFPSREDFDFRTDKNDSNVDKWYCGTALAVFPFFMAGHGITRLTGGDSNGYSFWYAWMLNIAAIFYCFIGLLALRKILLQFTTSYSVISMVLFLIVFGTNLFYYTTSEPAMSHVYSFAFINLFVLALCNFIDKPYNKTVFLMAVLLAMIVLIRPVNGLIVFIIPVVAGTKERTLRFFSGLLKTIPGLIAGFTAFCIIIFVQLAYYKSQTGSFFVYSYGGENFDLLNPQLANFLFSYKKGLFVYLPLTVLSLTGFAFMFRKNRWQFYAMLIFLAGLIYLLSCWWNWWFGGSFGTRSLVEYLFIFAVLLVYALDGLKRYWRKGFITLCVACVIICQVQTYQYRYYFIHWDEMNKARYWDVFMRVDLIIKKQNPNADLLPK